MANLTKIRLSGTTYTLEDAGALHTLDSTVTSGGTNAVQGSGIYNAITASTAALAESIAEQGYQTSGDVESAVNAATSGKVDTADFTAYTSTTDTALTSKFAGVNYSSNDKKIYFYDNASNTGTALTYVDATDFIKDGMVDNVEIKTVSGESVLAITFNSDAGKEEIDIPISDIFNASNYYTKTEIDTALSGKQDTLSAGTGIDISGDVISVTGVPLTVEDNVTSGSSNPVKSSGIYNFVTGETANKQDTLVSGTNIKTVGTQSLLGSGNIPLMTARVGTGEDSETLIIEFA